MFSWLKKYFIPHKHNDYRPHFLRHESVLLVLLFIIIVEAAFLAQVFIVFDKTNFLASVLPGVLTTMTNEERAQNGAGPLTQNDLLTKAAQLKATDMATNGYFAHTSPEGKTPWYWFDQVGYKYSMAGENLAVNFFESRDVAEAWMESPTHRANIVKKNYTEIGIGVATGSYEGRNTVFVAQLFGTPITKIAPVVTVPATTIKNTPTTKPKTPAVTPKPTTPKSVVTPKAVVATPSEVKVLGEEINTTMLTTDQSSMIISKVKSLMQKIISSPRESVNYIYGFIALLIGIVLLLVIFIKSEIQHPAIIARGLTLVAVILLLLFVNIKVLHIDTKIPDESLEASVIAY